MSDSMDDAVMTQPIRLAGDRYSRQTLFAGIGAAGQRRLAQASVAQETRSAGKLSRAAARSLSRHRRR